MIDLAICSVNNDECLCFEKAFVTSLRARSTKVPYFARVIYFALSAIHGCQGLHSIDGLGNRSQIVQCIYLLHNPLGVLLYKIIRGSRHGQIHLRCHDYPSALPPFRGFETVSSARIRRHILRTGVITLCGISSRAEMHISFSPPLVETCQSP